MAVKKPLVLTAGQIQELQSADEINIDASDVTTGTIATARLGSGTADATTFLRGDQTWATPSGGDTTYTVTTADIENTSTKTRYISFTVPANSWADGEQITITWIRSSLQNSGGTVSYQDWFGGTGITEFTQGAQNIANNASTLNLNHIFSLTRTGNGIYYNRILGTSNQQPFIGAGMNAGPAVATYYNVDTSVDFTVDIEIYFDGKYSVANASTYHRIIWAKAYKTAAGTV